MGALGKTKFGQKLGYDKLVEWINKRTNKATEGTLNTERLAVEVNDGARTINGKLVKINQGQQDKQIPGTNNYKQEIANGKPRSIFTEDPNQLLDKYAGTGQKINDYKERIDFGKTIGQYYDEAT
jgi:hypothetical protein